MRQLLYIASAARKIGLRERESELAGAAWRGKRARSITGTADYAVPVR